MDSICNKAELVSGNLSIPVYIIDKDYKIVNANSAFISEHASMSEKIGLPCYKLSHNSDIPCWEMSGVVCPAKEAFKTKERVVTIHKHLFGDKYVLEEVTATPINNGEYVLEEFRDLSSLLGLVEGILPICSSCKKIRDEHGGWHQIEGYLHQKTGADFSHSICPDCAKKLYPGFKLYKD